MVELCLFTPAAAVPQILPPAAPVTPVQKTATRDNCNVFIYFFFCFPFTVKLHLFLYSIYVHIWKTKPATQRLCIHRGFSHFITGNIRHWRFLSDAINSQHSGMSRCRGSAHFITLEFQPISCLSFILSTLSKYSMGLFQIHHRNAVF